MTQEKEKLLETLIKTMKAIVGDERIFYEPEDILTYSYDASRLESLPLCVVFPDSTEKVLEIVKEANRLEIPLYPRGAGSGMVGGAVPTKPGVVISFEGMSRILEIDEENFTCLVEPGVVTGRLQKELNAYGLFYPPDPSSLNFSTIGGNVATCAGGPRAVKYGVTRDYVMSIEAVTGSGKLIKTGSKAMKSVVGYDLTRLLVGSEGTLALFTKILLRLLPAPEKRYLLLVTFETVEDAAKAVVTILKHRIIPSAIEFIDDEILGIISSTSPVPIPEEAKSLLLIELDDPPGLIERNLDAIRQISIDLDALSIVSSYDEVENERLWSVRRSISPSLAKIRKGKINEDVAVPRKMLPQLVRKIKDISRSHNIPIASFGHAGDGNLHVNVLYDPEDKKEKESALMATEALFKVVLELGGTISGEHGIGIAKSPFIRWELDDKTFETMWLIKRVFDPRKYP